MISEDPELRPVRADLLDAGRDLAQRVDVETGVGLVEHGDVGLEQRHLEHLVALLLAAGEALVEVALLEAVVHAEPLAPRHDLHAHLEHRVVVDALAPRHRLAQEVEDRDAGDLLGVLEAEEQAPGGPLVGGERGDVLAREEDPAAGDLVDRVAEQRVGQRRLPGAVRAHQGVELAGPTARETPRRISRPSTRDVEVVDLERRGFGGRRESRSRPPL